MLPDSSSAWGSATLSGHLSPRYRLISRIVHVALGIIAGLLILKYPIASLTLTALFLIYEYVEETKVLDEMYLEVKEFTGGYLIGLSIVLILRALG
jgi:hypothetical protein